MSDIFYTPILKSPLTSMHKEKPVGIFKFLRVNRRSFWLWALGA